MITKISVLFSFYRAILLNLGINCLIFGGVAPFSLPVLEEGNLSKAAKQLNISQPPLSHVIKMLEEELETTLFFRGQRKITLTESGKILYSKAQHLLELQKQTTKEIQDLKKSGKGTIAFGCVSSAHMVLLEKGILPFYQKNPKITYELYEKNTYELIELLNANIIEFALIRTPFSEANFQIHYLNEDAMVAIYQKEKFSFKGKNGTLAELKDQPLILYRRFYSIIASVFDQNMIQPNIYCQCDDARTAVLWASQGLGIAIVPFSATSYIQGNENVTFSYLKESFFASKMAIIHKKINTCL